jgi:phosphomannomutase
MEKIFDKIRNGGKYCSKVGNFPVAHIRDLTVGIDTHYPENKPVLPVSTSTHIITFYFENGCQATLRGSGTEPKLKYYIEHSGKDKKEVHETLQQIVNAVIEQCLEPEKNGLQKPKD